MKDNNQNRVKMKRYLKFIGNRKDLKPLGFKFSKYFASNYVGYHLPDPEYPTEDSAMIWIAGKDCTLGNINSIQSAYIFDYIKGGKQEYKYNMTSIPKFTPDILMHQFAIDLEKG